MSDLRSGRIGRRDLLLTGGAVLATATLGLGRSAAQAQQSGPAPATPSGPPSLPRKITIAEFKRMINDPKTSLQDIQGYITVDEAAPLPLGLNLKPNPVTVDLSPVFSPTTPKYTVPSFGPKEHIQNFGPDVSEIFNQETSDQIRDAIGKFVIDLQNLLFDKKISEGYVGPILVSEGDSWFLSVDSGIVYELIMQHNLAIFCTEMWGDTIENMDKTAEFLPAIQNKNASIFLFSGGGNDILGGGNLKEHLIEFDKNLSPPEHLAPSFNEVLDGAMDHYHHILQSVYDFPGDVRVICHGYDYAIPNSEQVWPSSRLGGPMKERGIIDRGFQALIARAMIDRFNERLKTLIDAFDNTTYLDLRGIVGPNRWHDEIHPNKAAFADIAARYKVEIDKLT